MRRRESEPARMPDAGSVRLDALGVRLLRHMQRAGGSWQAFSRNFINESDARVDVKRLREFIAAYHELTRAICDAQPPQEAAQTAQPVVLLPAAAFLDEESSD